MAVAMGIGRFAFTPILPSMRDTFSLSATDLATLASSNYLGYLLGAMAASTPLVIRWQKPVLRGGLPALVVLTALMAASSSMPVWLVLRFLAGLASAGVFVFGSTTVLGWLKQQGRPELLGWFFGGVGVGIATSGLVILLVQRLVGTNAWQLEWLAAAVLAAIYVTVALLWLPPQSEVTARAVPVERGASRSDLSLPLILLGISYFLSGVGYIVAATFMVAIVSSLPGLSGIGAASWVIVGIASLPSTLIWARVATRLGPFWALTLCYLLMTIGLALPSIVASPLGALLSTTLLGGTFVGFAAMTIAGAQRLSRPENAARTIALLTVVFGLGQVIGPLLAAYVIGPGNNFQPALLLSSGVVLGSTIFAMAAALSETRRGHPRDSVSTFA